MSRHYEKAPRLIVIPAETFRAWKLEQATVVDATINGVEVGGRVEQGPAARSSPRHLAGRDPLIPAVTRL